MKRFLLAVVFLYGCGGESFTSSELVGATDPGFDGGPGGATASGAGGSVGFDGGAATRGAVGAGGATSGAGGVTGTGGAVGTGGAQDSGGAVGAGGAVACTLVTHDNGLGQTWTDCAPLGTYNETQAMKACKASGATRCTNEGCVPGNVAVIGIDTVDARTVGIWGYGGPTSWSFVCSGANCSGCPTSGPTWN